MVFYDGRFLASPEEKEEGASEGVADPYLVKEYVSGTAILQHKLRLSQI